MSSHSCYGDLRPASKLSEDVLISGHGNCASALSFIVSASSTANSRRTMMVGLLAAGFVRAAYQLIVTSCAMSRIDQATGLGLRPRFLQSVWAKGCFLRAGVVSAATGDPT